MQSSAVNLVRGAVMLGALVAIPLIAVFGRTLPGEIIELIDSHLAGPSAAASQTLPPAPVFSPDGRFAAADREEETGPAPPADPLSAAAPALRPSPLNRRLRTRVDQSPPVAQDDPVVDPVDRPLPRMVGLVPVVAREPQGAVAQTPEPAGSASPEESPPVVSDPGGAKLAFDSSRDRLASLQERLRQLGATYYRLELWGQDRRLYHFHCRIPVYGNPHFTRYFEDTDADPARAMEAVVAQIEAWRGSGGPSRTVGLATVPASGVR